MRKIKIVADSSCDLLKLNHTEFACAAKEIFELENQDKHVL